MHDHLGVNLYYAFWRGVMPVADETVKLTTMRTIGVWSA